MAFPANIIFLGEGNRSLRISLSQAMYCARLPGLFRRARSRIEENDLANDYLQLTIDL